MVALLAIAGGLFFWHRRRQNREIEEEHRRNAAVNAFMKPPGSSGGYSIDTDARLDPVMAQRRLSSGSIADNQDYSRRILRVCLAATHIVFCRQAAADVSPGYQRMIKMPFHDERLPPVLYSSTIGIFGVWGFCLGGRCIDPRDEPPAAYSCGADAAVPYRDEGTTVSYSSPVPRALHTVLSFLSVRLSETRASGCSATRLSRRGSVPNISSRRMAL